MGAIDREYKALMSYVLEHGTKREDRTGTGTLAIFGYMASIDISEYFPIVSLKSINPYKPCTELTWMLKGLTTLDYLLEHNTHIWDEWGFKKWSQSKQYKKEKRPDMSDFGHRCLTDEAFNVLYKKEMNEYRKRVLEDPQFGAYYGDLGPIYGKQWRSWGSVESRDFSGIDQLSNIINTIKTNPSSRRLVLVTYNPSVVNQCELPPCNLGVQFDVDQGYISCKFEMRSNDLFLGFPFDIVDYALLTYLIAAECDLKPGKLIYSVGNAHIYLNHMEQVKELLRRDASIPSPTLKIKTKKTLYDYVPEDFLIEGYCPLPAIKGAISV